MTSNPVLDDRSIIQDGITVHNIFYFIFLQAFCRNYMLFLRQNLSRKMTESIDNKVFLKIKKAKRGSLFFIDDFLLFGNAKAVGKALERLVDDNSIQRVARGIYSRLETDPLLGFVKPSVEDIAQSIAKRDRARIIPTGSLAMNILGLSSQIPMNVVFLTDGSARKIQLGKQKIVFKKTSPKNLAMIGKLSTLAIQALKEIGKDCITEQEIEIVLEQLKKEDPYRLEHDIRFAPEWIRIILRKAL
jgi:Family of unknown function (DUF6088)